MNSITFKSGLSLPSPVVLPGPMEGVMSPLFCRAVDELNLTNLWITPFLRVTTGPVRKRNISRFIDPFSVCGKPVILQLMGTEPEYMIETAKHAEELEISGVNFNLACPSRQVTRKGCGGALLQNIPFIEELLERSCELDSNFSVSLKIRTGFDSFSDIYPVAEVVKDSRLDFIAVHFRTVEEGYSKVTGRDERIKTAVKLFQDIPVIANGDISSYSDAEKRRKETGCTGIMVARGWLKNPHLLREISEEKDSAQNEKKQHLAEFIHSMAGGIAEDGIKRSRNSLIDFLHYACGAKHPFFRYVIKTPFEDIEKEFSFDSIMGYFS